MVPLMVLVLCDAVTSDVAWQKDMCCISFSCHYLRKTVLLMVMLASCYTDTGPNGIM